MSRHEWIDPEDKTSHIVMSGCAPGPLAREVLRLAEENAALKVAVERKDAIAEEAREAARMLRLEVEASANAVRDERARIRRELNREIGLLYSYLNNIPESDIWAIINRIIPGEG